MGPRRHILPVLSVTLLALALFTGCGDDNPVSPQDRLIGTWDCTRFEVTDGAVTVDFMALVESFTLTFTGTGTYTMSYTGDETGVICDGSANCTYPGTYSATSRTVTFDSEITLNYTISGNVLTVTGSDSGQVYDMRFVKV